MSTGARAILIIIVAALAIFMVIHYAQERLEKAPLQESGIAETSALPEETTPPPPPPPKPKPQPVKEVQWVTMDGTENGELMVPIINLWKDHNNRSRGVAGTVRHGARVKLIRRSGNGVLVETKSGTRGWATYYFVREFQ